LGYFGIFLLLSLPVVNLILLIVWACGGCAKDAKTRLARGALIYGLLCLILLLIGVILGILFWPMFQKWWMMVGAAFTFY